MHLPLTNKAPVTSIAVSPDGKWLAVGQTGFNTLTLTIWDMHTLTCVAGVEGHSIHTLSFNRHSNALAYTQDYGNAVFIFDLKTMKRGYLIPVTGPLLTACYARRKDLLLVCGEAVTVWDSPEISGCGSEGPFDPAYEFTDEATGEILSSLYKEPRPLFVYDNYKGFEMTNGLAPQLFKDYYVLPKWIINDACYRNAPAQAVFCEQDNSLLITGNNDNTFSQYDLHSGKLKQQYPGGVLQAKHMITDNAEAYLFVVSTVPRTNLLWKLGTMERALPHVLHDKRYGAAVACFHPSGRFLATAPQIGPVRFLDIDAGKFLERTFTQQRDVHAFAFSSDGKLLISVNTSGSVMITDMAEYLG